MRGGGFRFLVIALLCAAPGFAGEPHHLAHTGRKSLQLLIDQVELLTGYVVTYEAPDLEFMDDVDEVTEQRQGSPSERSDRLFAPRSVSISVTYETDLTGNVVDPEGLIRMLVDAGRTSAYSFRLVKRGPTEFDVIPANLRDAHGTPRDRQAVLDTQVRVDPGLRTGGQLIQAICADLERATGRKTRLVDGPERLLERFRTTRGIEAQSARDALIEVLHSIHSGLSWTFMCEPYGMCGLGIHFVRPRPPPDVHPAPPPADSGPAPGELPFWLHRKQ